MPVLENYTETKTTEYAEERGCISLKLNVQGRRGWPDRLYIYPGPRLMFIEFKRLGEKPRKLQEYIHGILRKLGCTVAVVDTIDQGRAAIDQLTTGGANVR